MSETVKPVWHGIPREQIDWQPTVISERCVGCGLCITSCGKNAYSFDFDANKPVIVAPQACDHRIDFSCNYRQIIVYMLSVKKLKKWRFYE